MLKQIINPDLYHGFNKRGNFFEGWYFKLVDSDNSVFSFIPGIFISSKPKDTFSFIQIFYGSQSKTCFVEFPFNSFSASGDSFDVHISQNSFSMNSMSLDINNDENIIKGNLQFKNTIKWPDSVINPGSMGFYNYFSFMECYSQVCALTGDIEGKLSVNGILHNFTGGRIYIEKNWGRAFPYSYIWTQCNSFNQKSLSVTCSIGHVPMPVGSFTGFLIGLYTDDEFYKFTTMNRSSISICFEDYKMNITAKNKKCELSIHCSYDKNKFASLYAPKNGSMLPIAEESLLGTVELQLKDCITQSILLEDSGKCAGIEFCGDYKNLC